MQTSAKASPLQVRKQQFVRDAIWDAAIDLFSQRGFDETTVEEIAQAAGVSRRTFFRYFSSKSDLMAQGIVSYGNALNDAIESCPAAYSPAQMLRATVLRVAQLSAQQPRTRKIMKIVREHPAAREAQLASLSEVQDQVAETFARCCRKGPNQVLAGYLLASLTLSLIGAVLQSWFDDRQTDISAHVERVFATLPLLICDNSVEQAGKQSGRAVARQKRKRSSM
jgi:AcrR family transcriptional regulator